MMQSKLVRFGPWRPDQPDMGEFCPDLQNAIPQAQSYRSIPSLNAISTAIDTRVLRGIVATDDGGVVHNFAGDAGKLYRLVSSAYNNVSKVGDYTVASWQFSKYGERIIATSLGAPVQYYDMGTSTLFADLAGSPPSAESIAVVRDFVVLGNLDDSGTIYPARVQWSGFNNSELWDVDAGAQSDFQDLFGNGGKIQRIVPGEYGVIFQESSIWRMDYAGPPTIFNFQEVERGRGTPAPNSVCWLGRNIYYWGGDGFYSFDGVGSTPIGAEKVDRFVKGRVDPSRYSEMYGTIDRKNNLVMWTYPLAAGGSEVIVYNWAVGEWGRSDLQVEAFTEFAAGGYTLDELDLLFADIDSASIPVDSTEFLGGAISLGAFDTDHKLAGFTGNDLTGELVTGEMVAPNGMRVFIQSARPMIEGSCSQSVAIGSRDEQCAQTVFGNLKATNTIGEAQFHKDVRFARFKVSTSGGFTHAHGVEAFFKPAGRR